MNRLKADDLQTASRRGWKERRQATVRDGAWERLIERSACSRVKAGSFGCREAHPYG
ncbi:MAG: hypothetical protein ACOX2K_03560 [Bacillota bacterium]